MLKHKLVLSFFIIYIYLGACATPTSPATQVPTSTPQWDWFSVELTDARTNETFRVNDYFGKVVLVETMAMWCPNCIVQANEVRELHKLLGESENFVSISLDVDLYEDIDSLKEYVQEYGFEWHFAIAPLEVARALGNLYSAQYLNPPLSPMLLIDADGNVHHLEYGIKSAERLQEIVESFLVP